MNFDYFGRKEAVDAFTKPRKTLDPWVVATQARLKKSLLRLSRRDNAAPVQVTDVAKFFHAYFSHIPNVHFFFGDFKLDDASAEQFMSTREENPPSRTEGIAFHKNSFNTETLEVLIPALMSNRNLLHLQVSANNLHNPKNLSVICKNVAVNKDLMSLVLCENKLNDKSAEIIAKDLLQYNSALKVLDLSRNEISNRGLGLICDALKEGVNCNTSLLFLGMRDNELTNSCCDKLAELIAANTSIMFLDVSDNEIEESGAKKLVDAIELYNVTIVEVNFEKTNLKSDSQLYLKLDRLIARNIDAPKRALEAALTSAKGAWRRAKLMVVGQGRAGKTATVRSLLGEKFTEEWISTVGAQLTQTKTRAGKGNGGWVSVGDEFDDENEFVNELLVNRAGGVLDRLRADARDAFNTSKKEPIVPDELHKNLLGEDNNSKDNNAKELKLADVINEWSDDVVLETARSHREQVLFSIWDYGGQQVFYTLHHLFLTKYGIYLCVFNLEDFDSDNAKQLAESIEYMKFWLNSCNLHAPSAPIFLIGTRSASPKIKLDEKILMNINKKLETALDITKMFPQIVSNNGLCYFPIDNKTLDGVELLRNTIFDVAINEDYVNYEVPVFWLRVLDQMNKSKGTTDLQRPYIKLQEVHELVSNVTGISALEKDTSNESKIVKNMLQFFHELGIIVHFTSSTTLKDIIILNPQWLLDALGKVIRDRDVHSLTLQEQDKLQKFGLMDDYTRLFAEGFASHDILEYFWKNSHFIKNNKTDLLEELKEVRNVNLTEFFVQIMKKTMLLSSWNVNTDVEERFYLVPALLPLVQDVPKLNEQSIERKYSAGCVFSFAESYLPIGFFERVICLAIDFASSKNLNLEKDIVLSNSKALIPVADRIVLLEVRDDELWLHIDPNTATISAGNILQILASVLIKIKNDVMNGSLQWTQGFKASSDGSILTIEQAKTQSLSPWFKSEVVTVLDTSLSWNIDEFLADF